MHVRQVAMASVGRPMPTVRDLVLRVAMAELVQLHANAQASAKLDIMAEKGQPQTLAMMRAMSANTVRRGPPDV